VPPANVRSIFLACARNAHALIARDEVARAWLRPSALEGFAVSGLAGHLARGATGVLAYLAEPEPAGPPIEAAAYFGDSDTTAPPSDAEQTAIRERGEKEAGRGHAALVAGLERALPQIEATLRTEPPDRLAAVYRGAVMRLDDYLVTRVVELTVHTDDLAASVGVEPRLVAEGVALAIEHLVAVALRRHGGPAVLRALARRERDRDQALRVF
jgi:hypothetical protein